MGVRINIIIGLADKIWALSTSIPKILRSIFSACNIQEEPVWSNKHQKKDTNIKIVKSFNTIFMFSLLYNCLILDTSI